MSYRVWLSVIDKLLVDEWWGDSAVEAKVVRKFQDSILDCQADKFILFDIRQQSEMERVHSRVLVYGLLSECFTSRT